MSRRNFTIRIRRPSGVTIASARVRVNGKPVRVRKVGGRHTARVDTRGFARGRFRVHITVTTASGKTLEGVRRYRTCVAKQRSRGPREL